MQSDFDLIKQDFEKISPCVVVTIQLQFIIATVWATELLFILFIIFPRNDDNLGGRFFFVEKMIHCTQRNAS